MFGWTPVTEEMPPKKGRFLAWNPHAKQAQFFRWQSGESDYGPRPEGWRDDYVWVYPENEELPFTHWMVPMAPSANSRTPLSTGVKDAEGNELFLGDHVRYRIEGRHTKQEYWNPEYEIIWVAPCFTLKHIGGGKDGGSHDFILKHGGGNKSLFLIKKAEGREG